MTNPFGWPLPLTDHMLEVESPYAPFADPAENIAERLTMLAHLTFNARVWGGASGRIGRYWPALGEHIETAASNRDIPSWWAALMQEISGEPILLPGLLHEKNYLMHPATLPSTQVPDDAVLDVFRTHTLDLRDRARFWVKTRRAMKEAALAVNNDADTMQDEMGDDEA